MKYITLFVCLLGLWWITGCSSKPIDDKLISVTIEPERYFAQKIAGDNYRFNVVVPAGQSPETYDPTPKEMVAISRSAAYFRIGNIGFEQVWMGKVKENNPSLRIYDLSKGMHLLQTAEEVHGDHTHGATDPHIWNSIEGAKVISWNILNALIEMDPDNSKLYWANYNSLLEEIEQTSQELHAMLDPLKDRTFIIYHPALTYFAAEFNLTQLCIEMDGKEPSPSTLKMLIETARNENAKVVFIQQEFDQKNAELIAKETGCKLVVINPLSFDWHAEMINIAKALADGQTD